MVEHKSDINAFFEGHEQFESDKARSLQLYNQAQGILHAHPTHELQYRSNGQHFDLRVTQPIEYTIPNDPTIKHSLRLAFGVRRKRKEIYSDDKLTTSIIFDQEDSDTIRVQVQDKKWKGWETLVALQEHGTSTDYAGRALEGEALEHVNTLVVHIGTELDRAKSERTTHTPTP